MEELLNLIYDFEEKMTVYSFEDDERRFVNAVEVITLMARLKYEIKRKSFKVTTQSGTTVEATSKDEAEMWKEAYKLLNLESQIKENTKGELKLWKF